MRREQDDGQTRWCCIELSQICADAVSLFQAVHVSPAAAVARVAKRPTSGVLSFLMLASPPPPSGWPSIALVLVSRTFPQRISPSLAPRGAGPPLFPLSLHFPRLLLFLLFPFLVGFNYFLLLSIPFLSTRIVPTPFPGRRS